MADTLGRAHQGGRRADEVHEVSRQPANLGMTKLGHDIASVELVEQFDPDMERGAIGNEGAKQIRQTAMTCQEQGHARR